MTHDELLAKIGVGISMPIRYPLNGEQIKAIQPAFANSVALRAVVELHKPIETYNMNNVHKGWLTCTHCNNEMYPCPTIQAIEKELN